MAGYAEEEEKKNDNFTSFMDRAGWLFSAAIVGLIGVAFIGHGAIALVAAACIFSVAAYGLYRAFRPERRHHRETSAVAVNEPGQGVGYSLAPALAPAVAPLTQTQPYTQTQLPPQQQQDTDQKDNNREDNSAPPPSQQSSEESLDQQWPQPSTNLNGASASQAASADRGVS